MRIRLTVRRAMGLVASVALGLTAWSEFRDGLPPRSVVRGIPARIARLKPGMSYRETKEVLGLEKSWLRGGTGAWPEVLSGNGHWIHCTYPVQPWRRMTTIASVAGNPPGPVTVFRSSALIQVRFDMGNADDVRGPERWASSARLTWAQFSEDGKVVAEMKE